MAGRTRKFNPVLSEQDKAALEKIVSSSLKVTEGDH